MRARDQSSIFSTGGKFCPDYGLLLELHALALVGRSYALLVIYIATVLCKHAYCWHITTIPGNHCTNSIKINSMLKHLITYKLFIQDKHSSHACCILLRFIHTYIPKQISITDDSYSHVDSLLQPL